MGEGFTLTGLTGAMVICNACPWISSTSLESESEDESADDSESESESVKNNDSLYETSERAIRYAFAIHVSKRIRAGLAHISPMTATEFRCPLATP